jgi:hypothetical protein
MLTSNLKSELEKTNIAFTRWTENKVDWLESSDINFKQTIEECAFTITALKENEMQLEELRSHNDKIKSQQKSETQRHVSSIESLEKEKFVLKQQVMESEDEEMREKKRHQIMLTEYEHLQKKTENAINDLTLGVRMYLSLGLEFQKTKEDSMKFIFTQIDPLMPSRPFCFTMYVDSEDKYNLVETFPALGSDNCSKLISALNNDNNIGRFVFQMRQAFCKLTSQ